MASPGVLAAVEKALSEAAGPLTVKDIAAAIGRKPTADVVGDIYVAITRIGKRRKIKKQAMTYELEREGTP